GRTAAPGELALAFHAQTYQEPRAFTQGLTQSKPPTPDQLMQLFWAAQGLSAACTSLKLDPDTWLQLWQNLFVQASGLPAPAPIGPSRPIIYLHADPKYPPKASPILAGSIMPLDMMAAVGPPVFFMNPQTDAAQRWRIILPAAGANADDRLA